MGEIMHGSDLPLVSPRRADSHKGTYGRILVVAGSQGMSGAAVLAGNAALRSGAGLVTVACPEPAQMMVVLGNPCYMTLALPATESGHLAVAAAEALESAAHKADAIAVGPGLGTGEGVAEVVTMLLATDRPLVLDADALNVLDPVDLARLARRSAPTVLTPHPGEFARLIGSETRAVQANRQEQAVAFARDRQVILLLKGHQTLVTDGARVYVNSSGNPGMATGGSGDVLTGIAVTMLAQSAEPFLATCQAAHVHGLAGDLAAESLGEIGMLASDIITHLPRAWQLRVQSANATPNS